MLKCNRILLAVIAMLVVAKAASSHVVDPNKFNMHDFATEVTYYEPGDDVNTFGSGAPFDTFWHRWYDRKEAALGAPSRSVRMYDGARDWVNPANAPDEANDIVSVGTTAYQGPPAAIILKFDHRVADDSRNPYGIDFIVFGNSWFKTGLTYWVTGANPESYTIGGIYEEPGIVSVSQYANGPWYSYDSQSYPRADAYAPTASRKWDSAAEEWGAWLDPTRPIDPNLTPSDFDGKTVAQAIEMYDGSAGGAGFDISVFGLPWIQYVKIEKDPDLLYLPEVDAISDVSAPGDINYDLRVDLYDFAAAASRWSGDFRDISDVTGNWLAGAGGAM
jgi:hypothetical protein